jgi:hypothetical protein
VERNDLFVAGIAPAGRSPLHETVTEPSLEKQMSTDRSTKPASDEHAPYYGKYVTLVPDGDIVRTLSGQLQETLSVLRKVSESSAGFRPDPGKWSIKEVIGHILDCERVFGYRALRFARNDTTALAGFEQDDYVRAAGFDRRTLADLLVEFEQTRNSHVTFFRSLDEDAWLRRGEANSSPVSVRALAWIMAGHEIHHLTILKERYLTLRS